MCKLFVCNRLFPNVWYETDIVVVKTIQIWDWIVRFMCANWGQIKILGKIISSYNLTFSIWGLFTFEIQTYWIISVSIFEWYIFKIHRITRSRILLYHIYQFSVSVQHSHPSKLSDSFCEQTWRHDTQHNGLIATLWIKAVLTSLSIIIECHRCVYTCDFRARFRIKLAHFYLKKYFFSLLNEQT